MADEMKKAEKGCRRMPLVDAFETQDGVTLQFELPGIPREDIKINVDENRLRVETNTKFEEAPSGGELAAEFMRCNFEREFVLSRDLDRNGIAAKWSAGVLALEVPKAESLKPRKIQITQAQE